MKILVECYSGYRADERPTAFTIGRRRLEIEEIIDRWYDPAWTYFKVRTGDSSIHIIRRSEECGGWELTMYRK
jgi:hypothetical protein